jgi:putative protease
MPYFFRQPRLQIGNLMPTSKPHPSPSHTNQTAANSANSNPMSFSPELLCPAGSPEKLRYAFAYGADAVYAGVPMFSLRARDNGFDWSNLAESIDYTHNLGKKLYLTVNIFARNTKINVFDRALADIAKMRPDGLIMSDPGLIAMVKEKHPELPIHLSVQANCMNWQAVKFWQKIGVERVILSRELRLEEIKAIKDHVPDMELEAFVHGSICIAYSGRCLLSRYMSYRDANQGVCDNSCRYPMKIHAQSSTKQLPSIEGTDFYLEDARNPDELYRIDEDEHGTYIMNAKDLRLIEYLQDLVAAGVCSLKIEGRTKSVYYLSVVTRAYRQAIDNLAAGRTDLDPSLLEELERITRRGYHSGFLNERHNPNEQGELFDKSLKGQDMSGFLGLITESSSKPGLAHKFNVRGKLEVGKTYEMLSPTSELLKFTIKSMAKLDGSPIAAAHPGVGTVQLETEIPFEFAPHSILRQPL